MIADTLVNAAAIMQGTLQGTLCGESARFQGLSTDTRTLRKGELFFALQGPNFDGGRFLARAAECGAAGAVVQSLVDTTLPVITVSDTRQALGQLAAAWRRRLQVTVIGLTGSNGKTTLKSLLANCLSRVAPTFATRGNLNNDIGLPLMLSELAPEHRYAVIEMGANHAGEIAALTALAEPEIAVITNAGPAHLEGFGSLDGVASAKGEILAGTVRPRCAVLNADDRYFSVWRALAADIDIVSFGSAEQADVRAVDVQLNESGSTFRMHIGAALARPVSLSLPGRHNVLHACAAAAVASRLDIDFEIIRQGLESAEPVAGRLQPVSCLGGAILYDDSYNANPASVIAAAEFIVTRPGCSWLVLGDMGELGRDREAMHREVGAAARAAGVSRLFATGPLSRLTAQAFGDNGEWFATVDALVDELTRSATSGVNILVKGSRAAHMERVVDALRADSTSRRRA
ncbi:MAG: UDP-N-acetylmuramoyl-tripeptide--D-alanyl-D-alanine ligase [Woeseia sp.]